MRILVLTAVCTLAALAAVAPGASAGPLCDSIADPGPVLDDTFRFACGRAECLLDGLPNIIVTCL